MSEEAPPSSSSSALEPVQQQPQSQDDNNNSNNLVDENQHNDANDASSKQISPEALEKFLSNSTANINVYPVVEGLNTTAHCTVMPELQRVAQSSSVRQLVQNAEYARHRWRRLNTFTNVEFSLEPVADGSPEDVVIRFFFTEKKTLKEIGIMSSGTNSNMPEIKATLQNLFGRAYELSCHVTPSTLKTLSYSAHLISHLSYLGDRTEYVLSKSSEPHPLHYGDMERIEQAKVVVHFDHSKDQEYARFLPSSSSPSSSVVSNDGGEQKESSSDNESTEKNKSKEQSALGQWHSSLSFGYQRRHLIPKDSVPELIGDGSRSAEASTFWRGIPTWLQHHFAPSTKGFLKYQLQYNSVQRLPQPWFNMFSLPVAGTDFSATAEVAGGLLGGATSLCRVEAQCIQHRTLFPFVVLDLAFRGGFATGFGGTEWAGADARWSDLRLNDRFFLNWRNVRGFLALGPNTNTEAEFRGETSPPRRFRCLGGNVVWAASASLNFPFPLWPTNGIVCGHVFANAGNLALVDNFSHLCSSFSDIVLNPKASVGCGLVAMQVPSLGPVPNGRLELNLSLPVSVMAGAGAGGDVASSASSSYQSPWVFDKFRWGLHWTSM